MSKNLTELMSKISANTLFVLDIDSSLVLTHKRNEAILRHFAQSIKNQNPELSNLLINIDCRPMEYGYFAALKRTAPHISSDEEKQLHTYWRAHFFSNDFLQHDIPHASAIEFVQELKRQQQPYVYLTGRPSNRMRPGTLTTLEQLGFPITDDILYMKPDETYVDETFKATILKDIIKDYDEVIFIDNEPKVLNSLDTTYPDMNLVFVDTCHSPNVTAPSRALPIKDFKDMLALLKR